MTAEHHSAISELFSDLLASSKAVIPSLVCAVLCWLVMCQQRYLCAGLQIVMSRTFGNAAEGGGIGVRMLVPLVDMLNHAGDETDLLPSGPVTAADNVR